MELFSNPESSSSSLSSSSASRSASASSKELKVDIRETRSRSSSSASGSSSSSSSSSSASEDKLNINQEYAARFQHNKERADLHRLQEKHGAGNVDDASESSSSSSEDETEDEDGEQVTADVDAAILTTLAKIRAKDESIYETGKRVFDEERSLASSSKLLPARTLTRPGSGKKVTLGDYQRRRIQELMKTEADPAMALAEATMIQKRGEEEEGGQQEQPLSHTREQEELRREVTNAFHGADGDDEEEDGFFTKREGQDDEDDVDDAEAYKKYLLDVLGGKEREQAVREALRTQAEEAARGDNDTAATTSPSKKDSASAKNRKEVDEKEGGKQVDDDEDFLMNYVLNRGWVDNPNAAPKLKRKPAKEGKVPKKISGGGGGGDREERDWDAEAADLDSEDSFDSRAEAFENAYNFRYEALEGGDAEAQIQSYARNPVGSVRRKEEKRKVERAERKQRKEEEKEEKKRELNRLRDLKRKDIVDRLKALKEATGSQAVDFGKLDFNKDFDPDEHDKLMETAFGEDYYGDDDEEKPTWDDDIDISQILAEEEEREGDAKGDDKGKSSKKKTKEAKKEKKKAKKGKGQGGGEDDDRIEMDADFLDGQAEDEEMQEQPKKLSKAEKKKLKKKEKAMAAKAATAAGHTQDDAADGGVDEDEMDADKTETLTNIIEPMSKEERKKKLSAAVDDYYNLEYEDVIGGDQPTRFKYTEVPKSNFGLSAVEILLAEDDQLNKVVNLKHLQPYKRGKTRPKDLSNRVRDFRRDLADRKGVVDAAQEDEKRSKGKRRMGKQERLKAKAKQEQLGEEDKTAEEGKAGEETPSEKKRKHNSHDGEGDGKEEKVKKPKKSKKSKDAEMLEA